MLLFFFFEHVGKAGLQCLSHCAFKISIFSFDYDGRIFSALIDFGTCQFHLVNVYAPNTFTGHKLFSKIYIGIFCPLLALLLVIFIVYIISLFVFIF